MDQVNHSQAVSLHPTAKVGVVETGMADVEVRRLMMRPDRYAQGYLAEHQKPDVG